MTIDDANMGLFRSPQHITPPMKSGQSPDLSIMDEYAFQDMCCALLEQEEDIRTCSVYGTRGQAQHGIDLLAHNRMPGEQSVAQCKCYEKFSPAQIRKASTEFFDHWEKEWSTKSITRFILMVACRMDSTKHHKAIAEQAPAFREKGITYETWSVSTICNKLRPHRGIVSQYINSEWVERICGPSMPTELTHAQPNPLLNEVLGNQLQQSWSVIARDTTSQLDAMRDAFRTGNIHQALDWIRQTRADIERWPSLTPDVQGKVLRFESSLHLELGDLETAKTLAAEARLLVPNFNDALLRSLLALHEHGFEAALNELNGAPSDVDTLNLRTSLLLENGQMEECCALLNMYKAILDDDPEALRLRGLMLRMKGDLVGAMACIDSAYSQKPGWVAVRFAKALVDFECALAPGILHREFCPQFRIIDWPFIRRDDKSLQLIRNAYSAFDELLRSSAHDTQQKIFLEGWKLSCLACDFQRQDEADAYCRQLIAGNPEHPVAIMWALGRRYATDALDSTIASIELCQKQKVAVPDQIIRLVMCLAAQGNIKKALSTLKKAKGLFANSGNRATWVLWTAQCLASSNQTQEALCLLPQIPDVKTRNRFKAVILRVATSAADDPKELIQHLLACYTETRDGEYLFDACSVMSQHNLWEQICAHSNNLLASVGTVDSVRLCAVALFNTKKYEQALAFVDTHKDAFPSGQPTSDIRALQVQCHFHLGQINEEAAEARILYRQEPSTLNLLRYTEALCHKGDSIALEGLVRDVVTQGDLAPDTGLYLCERIKGTNPVLAKDLLKSVLQNNVPYNMIAQALQQAFSLGLEREAAPLSARIPELAADPNSEIKAVGLQEVIQMVKDEQQARAEVDAKYIQADLPIHLLADRFGPNLAVFYHTSLRLNQNGESSPPTVLFARYGGMPIADEVGEDRPPWRISVDLTSLLLAQHIGILGTVLETFGPLRISPRAIPALRHMQNQLKPGQPARLQAQQEVCRLVNAQMIQVQRKSSISSRPEIQALLDIYPNDWVSCFEQMQAENGYLVDFLPPRGRDVLAPPPELPEICRRVVTNPRALLDALLRQGPLSYSEYDNALEALGVYGQEPVFTPIMARGCPVYLVAGTAELMAQSGTLEHLCERFTVFVNADEIEEFMTDLTYRRPALDETVQWLDELIDLVSHVIDSGKLVPTPRCLNPECHQEEISARACLLGLIASPQTTDHGDMPNILWCDDRSMQKEGIKNKFPVFGVLEILKGLRAARTLSDTEYYEKLRLLRAVRVFFIPLETKEVLHHLSEAQVTEGQLVETGTLAVLRRYAATCLLQRNALLAPKDEGHSILDRGEVDLLRNLVRVPSEIMAEAWNMKPYDRVESIARAEWVLSYLYVTSMGALDTTGLCKKFHQPEQREALDLAWMIMNALSIDEDDLLGQRPRRDYLYWIHDRILQRRFGACPTLLGELIGLLVDNEIPLKATPAVTNSSAFDMGANMNEDECQLAWKALLQSLVADLPESIQDGFDSRPAFLESIGILTQVNVDNDSYKIGDFYEAASAAVNGERAQCAEMKTGSIHEFRPLDQDEPKVPFCITADGRTHSVQDAGFWILHSSEEVCRKLLREHRRWFDCSDEAFEAAADKICALAFPQERYAALAEWRASSATFFYGFLHRRLADTQSVDLSDLCPAYPERILYHFVMRPPLHKQPDTFTHLAVANKFNIAEDGCERAFFDIACLPIRIPDDVVSWFNGLEDTARTASFDALLKHAQSPLSRMHLVRLALASGAGPLLERARQQISYLLSAVGSNEIDAFLALLKWVADGLSFWPGISEWSVTDRLVILWGHSSEVFRILIANKAPCEWVKETFANREPQVSRSFLERDMLRYDIANPKNLSCESFLLPGLAYALDSANILSDEQKADIFGKILPAPENEDGVAFPNPNLLRDPVQHGNALGSFLALDREQMKACLMGHSEAIPFPFDGLRENVRRAVTKLNEFPEDFGSWIQVFATLHDLPPYPEIQDSVDHILSRVDFSKVVSNKSDADATIILTGIAFRVRHTTSCEVIEHIRSEISKLAKQIASRKYEHEEGAGRCNIFSSLVEIAFSTALSGGDVESRARSFADSMLELCRLGVGLKAGIPVMTQRLTEELPPELARYFWRVRLEIGRER